MENLYRWLTLVGPSYNLFVMKQVGYISDTAMLDGIFSALADPTRRSILSQLLDGEASVNDLAQHFPISQPAISRHIKVLENAGLVGRSVDKQRRLVHLEAKQLAYAVNWLKEFKIFWNTRFDQLDDVLISIQAIEEGKDE